MRSWQLQKLGRDLDGKNNDLARDMPCRGYQQGGSGGNGRRCRTNHGVTWMNLSLHERSMEMSVVPVVTGQVHRLNAFMEAHFRGRMPDDFKS